MNRVLAFAAAVLATGLAAVTLAVAPAATADTLPARHMAACLLEDGSSPGQSLPCIWDGKSVHQGNGRGASYIVTSNTDGYLVSQTLNDTACAVEQASIDSKPTCRLYPVERHEWRLLLNGNRSLVMDEPAKGGGIKTPAWLGVVTATG